LRSMIAGDLKQLYSYMRMPLVPREMNHIVEPDYVISLNFPNAFRWRVALNLSPSLIETFDRTAVSLIFRGFNSVVPASCAGFRNNSIRLGTKWLGTHLADRLELGLSSSPRPRSCNASASVRFRSRKHRAADLRMELCRR
jgi:hypothetical protein